MRCLVRVLALALLCAPSPPAATAATTPHLLTLAAAAGLGEEVGAVVTGVVPQVLLVQARQMLSSRIAASVHPTNPEVSAAAGARAGSVRLHILPRNSSSGGGPCPRESSALYAHSGNNQEELNRIRQDAFCLCVTNESIVEVVAWTSTGLQRALGRLVREIRVSATAVAIPDWLSIAWAASAHQRWAIRGHQYTAAHHFSMFRKF